MSGWASGVQARFREKVPHAIYIHCYAHRLNLVLMNSLKNISQLNDVLNTIQTVYNYISNSNTRHVLFVEAQKELDQKVLELERTVITRWFYWYQSIRKIKLRYEAILSVLNILASSSCTKSASEAIGLKTRMESFQFIMCLHLLEKIFSVTNCLSEQLQNEKQNIIHAFYLVNSTRNALNDLRLNDIQFKDLYQSAESFAEQLELEINEDSRIQFQTLPRSTRVRQVSRRL